MNLKMKDQYFIVGGASAGLGRAVAISLLEEGTSVLGISRNKEALTELALLYPDKFTFLALDITQAYAIDEILSVISNKRVDGVLVNAGGPPAKKVMETTPNDWDDAYRNILRWKVLFTKELVKQMIPFGYGRILFLESASIKQPIENLVLSNSLRMAVLGFAKTLSREVADTGITVNVIGPGSHDTGAIERIYKKKSEQTGLPAYEVRKAAIDNIPVKALGSANDFAQLATWLLSPGSRYVTGQVYLVDGGSTAGV